MRRHFAIHAAKEEALNLCRDRSAMAGADLSVVELDRRDFSRRAGEKSFFGTVELHRA